MDIIRRGKQAIMCGGTGMYLESIILNYEMTEAPIDAELRNELEKLSDADLIERLRTLREIHNVTDLNERDRLIRAIEIANSGNRQPVTGDRKQLSIVRHDIFGIDLPREVVRRKITGNCSVPGSAPGSLSSTDWNTNT